jgi:hypothetical protein
METARVNKASTRASAKTTVFLSHSHADKDLVESTRNFLATAGVLVYVDWLDPEMPAVTNPLTALNLQRKISENAKFVLLATSRSLASRWVPWELGYADGVKDSKVIAVLPVVDRIDEKPSEYLGIYNRIEVIGTSGFLYRPGQSSTFSTLADWLRS